MTDDARVAYILSDELRVWLRRRPETIPVISTVLVYELAALIAKGASLRTWSFISSVHASINSSASSTVSGVGHEHP